jgi:hypothetical protein
VECADDVDVNVERAAECDKLECAKNAPYALVRDCFDEMMIQIMVHCESQWNVSMSVSIESITMPAITNTRWWPASD